MVGHVDVNDAAGAVGHYLSGSAGSKVVARIVSNDHCIGVGVADARIGYGDLLDGVPSVAVLDHVLVVQPLRAVEVVVPVVLQRLVDAVVDLIVVYVDLDDGLA